MFLLSRLLPVLAGLFMTLSPAAADVITQARYADPVGRYGHFALGKPHEYARLVVHTDAGRVLSLSLPEEEVFEDLAPRLVKLKPNEPAQLLTIVSRRDSGARMVLFRLQDNGLVPSAQSAPIGTPMRWLNPVGAADLDGDGTAEIAAVLTPHIGGTLKVYRLKGTELAEVAALKGFSNHVYGSPELSLSMPVRIDHRVYLLVPDQARTTLKLMALRGGALAEAGRCRLSAPFEGPMESVAQGTVALTLPTGRQVLEVRHLIDPPNGTC